MTGVAIFDLDKTLTVKGTWTRFVIASSWRRPSFWVNFPVALGFGAVHVLGIIDRDGFKERVIRLFLAGRSRAELEERANTFADAEVARGLRKNARKAVEAHQSKGDKVVIASAAVDLIAEKIAERLGINETLSTLMTWGSDDRLLSQLDGVSCYGSEKLQRIKGLLADNDLAGPVTIYSDHVSDLEALLWADKGVAVNPSDKLKTAAAHHGLAIEDWDA